MGAFITGKRVLAVVFIIAGTVMLRATYTAETGFLAYSVGMGPMTYPRYLLFGWLSASVLYFILRGTDGEGESIRESLKAVSIAVLVIAAYVVMFCFLGFLLSTAVFLVVFFYAEGYRNLKVGLPTAISSSVLFWFIFERILEVPMPDGVLPYLF